MPKIKVTAAKRNPRKKEPWLNKEIRKHNRRVKRTRAKRRARTRITRVRKNAAPRRASQKFVVEALQRRGDRKFKFWYWDGTRLTTDRGAAMQFANAALAKPVARRVLQGVPSSVLYVRVVKA